MTKILNRETALVSERRRSGHAMRAAWMALALTSCTWVAVAGASSSRTTTERRDGVTESNVFDWKGKVASGKTVEIKGVNGDIHVRTFAGDQVELRAVKSAKRSDPDEVTVEVIEHEGGVTFCAHYPAPFGMPENECKPGRGGRNNTRDNDVRVEFTVDVPAGVNVAAHTVNGDVDATPIRGDVEVSTVNGSIDVSATGTATATTVNGSITAELGRSSWTDLLEFETVNGSITLTMPNKVNADMNAQTVNGDIDTDFPFTVSGKINRHHIHAKIGDGGGDLSLSTVNGDIHLQGKGTSH